MPDIATADRDARSMLRIFLRLGLTSFGGPIAHLGYFREEFVVRRRWLDDRAYADLVALCQFLPGPASSQVGLALGLMRARLPGAFAAWVGFTLPSALLLTLAAWGLPQLPGVVSTGLAHGLQLAAVAVVAQAVVGMSRTLCRGPVRMGLAVAAAAGTLLLPAVWMQLLIIAAAGIIGVRWLTDSAGTPGNGPAIAITRRLAVGAMGLFIALLIGLPLAARAWPESAFAPLDALYRVGSLVFGGGHVVLPLLRAEVVTTGWVDADTFIAGYGLAQAVPGPLFAFAAFLGAAMTHAPTGLIGAALCLAAIYLPSFLLVFAALPFWTRLRERAHARAALAGVNAAVVGLLAAALYNPLAVHALRSPADVIVVGAAFALLWRRTPPWVIVIGCGLAGLVLR